MTEFETVKENLRVKTAAFDGEIAELIEAGKADLRLVGIKIPEGNVEDAPADPLIRRALIFYAKANFGFAEVDESAAYQKSYDNLKSRLSMAGDYCAAE
jgi:hypothetical protein